MPLPGCLTRCRRYAGHVARYAVVAAGTEHGNEVMAHLGAISGLPMAANCVAAAPLAPPAPAARRPQPCPPAVGRLLLEEAVLDAPAALLTVATDAVAPSPRRCPARLSCMS